MPKQEYVGAAIHVRESRNRVGISVQREHRQPGPVDRQPDPLAGAGMQARAATASTSPSPSTSTTQPHLLGGDARREHRGPERAGGSTPQRRAA